MRKLFLLSVMFVVLLTAFVVASVSFKGENLIKSYSGGDIITGTVNLSFNDEPAGSLVSSNFLGNLTLLELLETNGFSSSEDFSCTTANCLNDYSTGDSVGISHMAGEKVLGLSVQGNSFDEFQDVGFIVTGNGAPSCSPQLSVDFLGDGKNVLSSSTYIDEQCFNTKRGCFETNLDANGYQLAVIPTGAERYCERIQLPPGPAYKLGANVVKSTNGTANLKMSILSLSGNSLGSCILPAQSQQVQALECVIKYPSAIQNEYYVCINAEGPSNYKLKVEFNETCGTDNPGGSNEEIDYDLFAKNLKFSNPRIEINSSNFNSATGVNFYNYLEDYIISKYDSSCVPDCVIPIKFSGIEQDLSFSNVNVEYKASGAGGLQNNNVYETSVESSKINSNELEIGLSHAGFEIPLGSQEKRLKVYIANNKIVDVPINLSGGFDFDISPGFVSFGQETSFNVISSGNITRSVWNFGDGNTESSNGKSISYTYTQEGEFNINVRVTAGDGSTSSKNFSVIVGDPESSANATLKEYRNNINSVKSNLLNYSVWVQDDLKGQLEIDKIDGILTGLQARYSQATTDDEFRDIMLDLIQLRVPSRLENVVEGVLPLGISSDSINVDYLEQVSGTNVPDKESLKKRVEQWMGQNFNAEISFKKVQADYKDGNDVVLTLFEINPKPIGTVGKDYLFIDFSKDQIVFDKDYGQQDVAGATFISLTGNSKVGFYILGDVDPQNLGAYISPGVSDLGGYEQILECDFDRVCEKDRGETNANCPTDCRPYGTAFVLILIVVLGGIVAYIGMRIWYQRNYENKLFRKRLDLYNITNFVKEAKKKGMKHSQIKSKLKGAGWTGEQIAYAIKKAHMKPEKIEEKDKNKK